MEKQKKLAIWVASGIALLVLPLLLQSAGNFWVRIADTALLYVLLSLGLNIVVGYAGLLDLGFVAFFAIGAYMYGLMASPHLSSTFPWFAAMFPDGLHTSVWLVIPMGAALAGVLGILLGAPTLKLRGDYLAIVTLGFGEIIRVFLNNLDHPVNLTNGPKGLGQIDSITLFKFDAFGVPGINLGRFLDIGEYRISSVTLYYYLFLALVVASVIICHRLELSRIGRAWMAIREDEIAAKAMGINTRNMKLLAFGMGATFGGVSGVMFSAFQGFVSPESFSLMESVMIVAMVVLGGIGHLPGVILGAVLLSALPEVLRWVSGAFDLQSVTGGRLDPAILRQLLIALAMIIVMLLRPRGLWPSPEHGKALQDGKSGR
ncbi:branched-chain amino acid ABC transporter permease [Ramlibacter sp. Leaf400]|uniref:branched-chain amino acid ABC transporter permease n=1 Tax=Ramlibacter sp. Leaf400 TaxID=1736365 RepID=UPI0006F6DF54|nr:ABC transporter ATP-binding protein [Ramlibacter sp. Leaf400]KQT09608.1 ABC transporter ATP-binding protein [Ramlibacter sp. Leaf400]